MKFTATRHFASIFKLYFAMEGKTSEYYSEFQTNGERATVLYCVQNTNTNGNLE